MIAPSGYTVMVAIICGVAKFPLPIKLLSKFYQFSKKFAIYGLPGPPQNYPHPPQIIATLTVLRILSGARFGMKMVDFNK